MTAKKHADTAEDQSDRAKKHADRAELAWKSAGGKSAPSSDAALHQMIGQLETELHRLRQSGAKHGHVALTPNIQGLPPSEEELRMLELKLKSYGYTSADLRSVERLSGAVASLAAGKAGEGQAGAGSVAAGKAGAGKAGDLPSPALPAATAAAAKATAGAGKGEGKAGAGKAGEGKAGAGGVAAGKAAAVGKAAEAGKAGQGKAGQGKADGVGKMGVFSVSLRVGFRGTYPPLSVLLFCSPAFLFSFCCIASLSLSLSYHAVLSLFPLSLPMCPYKRAPIASM